MFSKKYRNLVWISADVDLLLQRLASDWKKICLLCPFKVWREPADEEHSGGATLHSDRQSQAKRKSQKGVWINCLRDLRLDWWRNTMTHLQFRGCRLKKAKQYETTATTASITSQITLALLYPHSLWKFKYLGFMFWCEFVPKWGRWCNAPVCEGGDYFGQLHRPHLLYFRAGGIGLCRLSQWLTHRKEPQR